MVARTTGIDKSKEMKSLATYVIYMTKAIALSDN